MFRNLGSAIGISVVNTMLVRRLQIHRSYLAANLVSSSSEFHQKFSESSEWLRTAGGRSTSEAAAGAMGLINEQMNRQASVLTYMDCFRLLMWISLLLLPFAILFHVQRKSSKAVRTIVGERSYLSTLRTRYQLRRVGPESNHHRNCDLSELRNTSSLDQDVFLQADQRSIIKRPNGEKTLNVRIIGCR